jgi:AcrR family transcriptional regulator
MVQHKASTAHGQATRDRIIEETINIVCKKGFAGTSVREICEAVGVAKTALYWHFGSKTGLMSAMIEDVTAGWIRDIETNSQEKLTPKARLDKLLADLRDLVDNRSHLLRVLMMAVMEQGTVESEIRETVRDLTDRTIQAIMQGYKDTLGIELPDMDLVGHTIVALLHASLRRRLMQPDADMDRLFKDMQHTINLLVSDRLKRYQAGSG